MAQLLYDVCHVKIHGLPGHVEAVRQRRGNLRTLSFLSSLIRGMASFCTVTYGLRMYECFRGPSYRSSDLAEVSGVDLKRIGDPGARKFYYYVDSLDPRKALEALRPRSFTQVCQSCLQRGRNGLHRYLLGSHRPLL